MKRVLITGASSYIGTSFARYKPRHYSSKPCQSAQPRHSGSQSCHSGLDPESTFLSLRNQNWKEFDFSSFDTILHCAGIAHIPQKKEMRELYFNINCVLTVDVAKQAKAAGVKQFIFLSSMSVFEPQSFYGASKLAAEEELKALETNNFSICILRPPMVYGYGCKGNFPRLVKLAATLPIFPNIQNARSMIYIDNLCEFIHMAIAENKTGTHHPQNTEYVNTTELAKLIAEIHGRRICTTKFFNWLIKILQKKVKPLDKLFGSLTYEKTGNEADYNVVNFRDSVLTAILGKKIN